LNQLSDAVLENALRGDVSAFEEVMIFHEKLVYNIAYRMLSNPDDASDITQEAFIRLFKHMRSFESTNHIKSWLCRVAHNLCIDELRRRKNKPAKSLDETLEFEDSSASMQLADDDLTPEETVILQDDLDTLQRAIAKLPEEYRTMITLRDLGGLSYQEVAEITELEMGTVKSRLSRARTRLKELFLREQSELRIVK